jgi:hypothetical protein
LRASCMMTPGGEDLSYDGASCLTSEVVGVPTKRGRFAVMNTIALIVTCVSGSCSFACLIAGYAALLSADQRELDDFKRRYRALEFRGTLAWLRRWSWARREALPLSQVVNHWRTRPEVRRLIYVGCVCFLVALVSGHFSSLPK